MNRDAVSGATVRRKTLLVLMAHVVQMTGVCVLARPQQPPPTRPSAVARFECWSTPDDLPPFSRVLQPCFSLQPGAVALCRCNDIIQDCSSNSGKLSFVPRVRLGVGGVQVLNFSNNNVLRVDDTSFFANLSRDPVWLVDLYNNNMTSLAPGVFASFNNLTTLLVGGNRLSYEALRLAVFSVPTLKKMDIKCGGLGIMPSGYFNRTSAVHLEDLDMSWNKMRSLDMAVLQPLVSLRTLTLWHNKLYNLDTAFLPSLHYMSFHKNGMPDFPRTCQDGTNKSLFPNLIVLDLNFNLISALSDPICLPKLRVLNLQYNQIQHFYTNMFSELRFPVLIKLELNQMESMIRQVDGYTFNNSVLEFISFGLNNLDFSNPTVSEDIFAGCDMVQVVFLNYNNFGTISVDKFQRLFRPMPRLRSLYLANSQIAVMHRETFRYISNLGSLDLNHNALMSLPDGMFDDLSKLKNLGIQRNRLTSISSDTFGPGTRARLHNLDLSGNPFECSCGILWFQNWLRMQPQLFIDTQHLGYNCNNLRNTTVRGFFINKQACILTRLAANDIIIVVSIIFSLLILFTVVYGYRWPLRLWLYEVCRGRHERRRRQAERQLRHYRYDVFLAYAEEDMDWVQQELLPVLEEDWRLRVCVHQRDFVPGKHIVDNISDSVSDSDRILTVFSPHFARSQWCQFELKLCQTCAMDRDDVMVVVKLEDTEARTMTGAMLAVMLTTTYIEWENEPRARASFWGRLKYALSDAIENRP